MTLLVAPVDVRAARYAVEHWHYSQRMPVGTAQRFGVWEHERYIGCVLFGRGASLGLGRMFGIDRYEVCELTRIALDAHSAPVSQIVPLAIAQLRQASPGTRCVMSFADPYRGHHGGIYQAMSWLYLGTSVDVRRFRQRSTGVILHQRVVSSSGVVRQFGRATRAVDPETCDLIVMPGKHRYALPLDRAMRRQLLPHCEQYPHAVEVSTVTR